MALSKTANRRCMGFVVVATLGVSLVLAASAASAATRVVDDAKPTATSFSDDTFTPAELLGTIPAPQARGFAVESGSSLIKHFDAQGGRARRHFGGVGGDGGVAEGGSASG